MAEQELTPVASKLAAGTTADRNPAFVYLARLAPTGRRSMRQALAVIAQLASGGQADLQTLPWGDLRFQHTAAIRAALAERYAPATANKMLAALRGTLRAAWRLELLTAEEYARAVDLEPVRGETLPRGRAATAGEISALLDACTRDATPAGLRDGALLATLYGTGARRAEVVAADLADYDPLAGRLVLRGKGKKERMAYLTPEVLMAISDWLDARGREPGPLFMPVSWKGRVLRRRLTAAAVYRALEKRCGEAGVKALSPHDLRRTFVSDLLDAGADIAAVQKLAGHATVKTTTRYDRRPEEARRKAAALLHVPYRRSRKG